MKRIILAFVIIVLEISGIIYYNTRYLDSKSNINFNIEDETIVLQVNTPYTQEIPKAIFRDTDITDKVKITNNLNINKIGKYEIVYKVKYKSKSVKRVKTIYIVDNIKPVITLNGDSEIDLYLNQAYNEQGAIATDNYDGDISDKIKVESNLDTTKEGTYNITYTVSDSSFNTVSIERKVNVKKRPVRTGVAVLNYHFFYDDNESNCTMGNCISTSKFEQHLKYLKDNGFKTLSMKEFKEWMYGEINIPSKSVLITIDDGALGTGRHNGNKLIPLLEKYQANATLFLITGWWDIENYRSPYLDIESHTNDMHTEGYCSGVTRGAKMLCLSHDEVLNDLKQSISITNSNLAFCFPFYAYNNQAIEIVKEAGFKLAFVGGGYKATPSIDKYRIPRYQIHRNITLDSFINIVN